MLERSGTSVLVVNARPLWIRLLFRELGKFVSTTGVVFDPGSGDCPITESELAHAPGWKLVPMNIPKRSFGRLAELYAPWLHRCLRKRFGRAQVVVFTQPSQRCLVRYFEGSRRIYYVADDYRRDYGWDTESVDSWERIIVDSIEHVVCVSNVLARSMVERLPIDESRISVSANGLPACLIPRNGFTRRELPIEQRQSVKRPLAGVFGTVSRRVRLDWLRGLIDALPWLNLLLVGPRSELSGTQLEDWNYLAAHTRCTIIGEVGYYELFNYAACVEVGLIPLTDDGINPASSPTRFFTQLPFGQPIIATEGSLQLREFEPLVTIVKSLSELIRKMEELRRSDFDDELAEKRRDIAHQHTWEKRAESFYRAFVCQQP